MAWNFYWKGLDLEKKKDHKGAAILYESAIEAGLVFHHATKRLAIFYRKNKDFEKEIRLLSNTIRGMNDPYVQKKTEDQVYYEHRLEKVKKLCPDQLLESILNSIEPIYKKDFKEVFIKADNYTKIKTGSKTLYKDALDNKLTIEQVAIKHYESLGYTSMCTENIFWSTISHLVIKDGFSMPQNYSISYDGIREAKYKNEHIDYINEVLNRIPDNIVKLIINRVRRVDRAGLPDLTMFKGNDFKLAEVKAPKEKISQRQIDWHKFLRKTCNLEVDIIRVE